MQQGKITSIDPDVRQWNGPNGTVYYFKIQFDNGDVGEIGKKNPNALTVGDELWYTITPGQYGNKIKQEMAPQNGSAPASPAYSTPSGNAVGSSRNPSASFALSYAKDLAVANIAAANEPLDMNAIAQRVTATASIFNQWLKENG